MKNNLEMMTSLERKSCAERAMHCLAASGIADWQSAYEQQIANAKKLGLMPHDFKVVRETLRNFGFIMQGSNIEGIRIKDMLERVGSFDTPATILIHSSDHMHRGGNMIAIRMERNRRFLLTELPSSDYLDNRRVVHVWIRWSDGVDRSPYPRRAVERNAASTSGKLDFPETAYYKPFQPNPHNNVIGDCVVRATAGALDISWDKAIDILAVMQELAINTRKVYPQVLKKHGFIYHQPLTRNGCHLDGKTFCEEMNDHYCNGERIFALVGRSHAAAIVPVGIGGGEKSYKIIDSWDSSTCFVGEYWVLPAKCAKTGA